MERNFGTNILSMNTAGELYSDRVGDFMANGGFVLCLKN